MPPDDRQHGVKGVYYGGEWLDLEDCPGKFLVDEKTCNSGSASGVCAGTDMPCPRSRSRHSAAKTTKAVTSNSGNEEVVMEYYDVVIVGAGCIGSCIARELSRYQNVSVLLLEAADDVSQGATKGNSGIVHAGYDDTPGSNRAKYCWKGNQMFAALDRELRFGYQRNGSLVVAMNDTTDLQHLYELKQRGVVNGVQNLRIVQQPELRTMEPALHPDAVAALYSPDAGNVIPYEYTIALAENAVDNGVELRTRRIVTNIDTTETRDFLTLTVQHWEPADYVEAITLEQRNKTKKPLSLLLVYGVAALICLHYVLGRLLGIVPMPAGGGAHYHVGALAVLYLLTRGMLAPKTESANSPQQQQERLIPKNTPVETLVQQAGPPIGGGGGGQGTSQQQHHQPPQQQIPVQVNDMLLGGSGSSRIQQGIPVAQEVVRARFVINCAGGAADQIAAMIHDDSFHIKPRLGDYLLLHRNQGKLAKHTIFPCPDPILGKGVLVQTTLWGNLILGPTARDVHNKEVADMTPEQIQEYILSKCKMLVPSFDPKETIHAFCGARAKSDRGDWIIGPSPKDARMIHVAGIDSPGLAGSPAIAVDVVQMLQKAGLKLEPNPKFNPNRAPIITPKDGLKGLKMGPVGKNDSDGSNMAQMAANVICKCERVTEMEVVRALRRSLPVDSSQAIRKRTRAGMGHCQGDPDNYNCEARVRAIIARENGVPVQHVGGRPWPATSALPQRWISDAEKQELAKRMNP